LATPEPVRRKKPRAARPLAVAVTALVVIAIAATGWITIREFQVQRSVYDGILRQKLEYTRLEFRSFLSPLAEDLATMARWQEAGLLTTDNPRQLLLPLVDSTPQVAAVYIVPETGPAVGFLRTADGWHQVPADSLAGCRDSKWYLQGFADTDTLMNWSGYVPLPGDGDRSLIATRKVARGVIGLGIRSEVLNQFTATASITENGILVRRFENGQITWLAPRAGNVLDVTDSGQLLVSGRPEHEVISQALLHWGSLGQPFGDTFQFDHGGRTWWGIFYPSDALVDPGELGLLVPAGDLHARFKTSSGKITTLFVVLLAMAMFAVVALAFDYRNKWRRFARRALPVPHDDEALRTLIAGGETDHVEFKSTMRWNLHANKPGKEIELAWLKSVVAYLNSNGGFVIIGVKDDGEILGLEKDGFRNDDKLLLHFENLIKQHVGLLFASYIKGEIRILDDRQVFLVCCERCPEPVFLRNGDDEKFFVRIGPSTHVVPASQIVDYMAERDG